MKKLISIALSVSMLLSGAVVYAADPVTVIDEQFNYADIEEMKAAGWNFTIPSGLTEAYTEITDGKLKSKMSKNLADRSEHTIIVEKELTESTDGLLTVTAGLGLDETGSKFTNSYASISLIDESGNVIGLVKLQSAHTIAPTVSAFEISVGDVNKSITNAEYEALGGRVVTEESALKGTIFDGTIYDIKLVSDEKEKTLKLYAEDIEVPILSLDGVCIAGAKKICISHMQRSYKKSWGTNSAALFDYVTITSEAQQTDVPPPPGGDGDEGGDDEPPAPPVGDNDPAQDEDEGINNQQNILYDDFATTDAWDITLPDQTGLAECYTEVNNGVVKTKMQKTLANRETHTISLHKKLDKELCTETVIRAGLGLEETGSKYTNTKVRVVLKDILGNEVVRMYMNSSYGGSMATNAVLVVKTNQIEQTVLGSDFPVEYKEETFDLKLHLKPEEGTMDFYAEDMEKPVLSGIPYDAKSVFISDVLLEHEQISYNKGWTTNSAGYFDYIKIDADIEVKEEDVKKVQAAAESLGERHLTTEDKDNVTKRITLPEYSDNGCTIVWTSSDEGVISTKGIVTRAETENKTVTLTARFISGYADCYKEYKFTVPAIGVLMWSEYFYEDYSGEAAKGEWTMNYPSPKAENTDCFIVSDPENDKNRVMRLANHMTTPQAYAGFSATSDLGFMFDGRGEVSFVTMIEDAPNSASVNFHNNNGQTVIGAAATSTWAVNGMDTGVKVEAGKWTEFLIDINTYEGYMNVYIDGKDCGVVDVTENYDKNYKIARYNLYTWNRSSGRHAKLYIDNLRIDENLNVHLDKVRSGLSPIELMGEVAGSFTLPTVIDGVGISWSSSDTGAISVDSEGNAAVVRGTEDKAVTVTAKLNYKGCEVEKTFNTTVIHQLTDEENVTKDIEFLNNADFSDEDRDRVTKSFDLPEAGKYSSEIVWTSGNEAVIKIENGKALVTAPKEDTAVALTASVKCGGVEKTEEFVFTVYSALPENLLTDAVVIGTSSELYTNPASKLVDSNFSTSYKTATLAKEHETIIQLKEESKIGAFLFAVEDNVKSIELLVSADNDFYKSVYKSDSVNNGRTKVSVMPSDVNYVKFILTPKDASKSAEVSQLMAFETLLSDSESVNADLEKISIPQNVSADIDLPTVGENGSSIVWSSSDEDIIEKNGNVIRGSKDEDVTLTATATKNGATATKEFKVTVKAKAGSSGGSGGGGSSGGGISSGSGNSSIVLSGITVPEASGDAAPSAFDDVNDKMWSYKYINMLREKGIVSGDGGNFRPKNNITREEFATMLYKCAPTEPEMKDISFSDMDEAHWAYEFVKKLYSDGIISGMGENEFGTGVNITRQDAAVMICRVLEKTHTDLKEYELKFSDSDGIADYAKAYIAKLSGTGIINGRDDNTFAPKDLLTREEAAKMMCVLVSLLG